MKPKKKIKTFNELYSEIDKTIKNLEKSYTFELTNLKNKLNMAIDVVKKRDMIWCPKSVDMEFNTLQTNTWFTIKETDKQKVKFTENEYALDELEEVKYKSKKVILKLTKQQKDKIDRWLNAFLDMYNIALKYIKDNIRIDKKVLNFIYLRSKLGDEKKKLVEKSGIKVHDIDYAIKLVCQNYKSALTNLKNGNIKTFRIRYWRKNKDNKIVDLEKADFNKNSIRIKELGKIIGYYDGKRFNFNTIDSDCRLQKLGSDYYLFVPEKIDNNEQNKKKSEIITIDPGIRKFGTGITENKIVKIGEGCGKKIGKYLLRKDKIMNNEEIDKKIKKKNEKMINRKIKNKVTELHWKTINYLTSNYETILIGNMSIKSIVSKKNKLSKLTKRIGLSMEFNKFHQRLKYKCYVKKISYGKINEWMTTKMCSRCGEINEKVGASEVFECAKCRLKIDRDVNSARGIHIKGIKL